MLEELPHIVVFSYNEKNVENFIAYLKNKFEVLEDYANSDKFKITYDDKRSYEKNEEDEGNYIFQNISKIKIVNKYYSADVILSSCIYSKILNAEKEIHIDNILYESIIFLFDDFNIKEKNIINHNPFINYNNDDCMEYIKDGKNGNMIRNVNFDFSNLYKDIGIKIAIFPLSFQEEKNTDILYFFSEYFIEALYINYNLTHNKQEIPGEQEENINKTDINDNKSKNKNITKNKFDEFYEDDERLVEALHCHMWKGLQMKKANLIMQEHLENNLQSQDKKEEENKTNNNDKKEEENKMTQNKENYQNLLKKDQIELKNQEDKNNIQHKKEEQKKSQIHKEDMFMQNFNKIVEKIKQVKIENTNCNNDNVRRKKAEELILELQQYFCDIDE
ncbi:conserved Plasmodium protein, unknown function [Plasmodium sp. gorilla clade G3]|nr:conserved Plasmodium protein, unknown function [Plasmodium sp. gorilla clade G3]